MVIVTVMMMMVIIMVVPVQIFLKRGTAKGTVLVALVNCMIQANGLSAD
jgi:hypothetical protein